MRINQKKLLETLWKDHKLDAIDNPSLLNIHAKINGNCPSLTPSDKFNKKGKELLKVVVDEEVSVVVQQIFDWVDLEGYGQYLIPEMLNKRGITTRIGKPLASNTISAILRNPTFLGYMTYARGKDNEFQQS